MAKTNSYQQLSEQLDEIIAWFESADFDIDEAVKQYERGLALIEQLKDHLQTAENKVQKLSASFDKA